MYKNNHFSPERQDFSRRAVFGVLRRLCGSSGSTGEAAHRFAETPEEVIQSVDTDIVHPEGVIRKDRHEKSPYNPVGAKSARIDPWIPYEDPSPCALPGSTIMPPAFHPRRTGTPE